MVFQSYALYPHMTVYDNMAFGMKLGGGGKDEIDKRVREAAEMLQITPYLDRLPKQLSGGQRQRVAIGRAIVRDPKRLPLRRAAVEPRRGAPRATRIEINKLHERMPDTTMIYVTHDQVEAMTLADRIVVLNAGIVEQVGSPMELYHRAGQPLRRPLHRLAVDEHRAVRRSRRRRRRRVVKPENGGPVKVAAADPGRRRAARRAPSASGRRISTSPRASDAIFTGTIDIVEHLGEVTLLYVDCGNAEEPIVAKLDGIVDVDKGDKIGLTAPIEYLHVFDETGKAFLRAGM